MPTNAGTGFVSVTTPSGTAISTNIFTVFGIGGGLVYSGILAGWDTSALSGFGPSPFATTTNGPGLTAGGLTRGAGVKTAGGGLTAGGWGGTSFTNLTEATAIASNQFVTFSIGASNGYVLSFTSVSRFDYRRSAMGPTNGVLQFQIGGGLFTDLASFNFLQFQRKRCDQCAN